ncbi:hypothetical protein ACS0TY_024600 [Phlomoides rotata]
MKSLHQQTPFLQIPKKKRSSSLSSHQSASIIGSNDDLLTEILILLPATSLIRFKLVSKHWKSLISAKSFTSRHFRRRPEPQQSFILGVRGRSQFFICHPTVKKLVRFRFRLAHEHVKILQACNGLLLLETGEFVSGSKDYYVFNPITNRYRQIHHADSYTAPCLLFDPSKSEHYRVVLFKKTSNFSAIRFSVYDSSTHEWRDGGENPNLFHKFSGGVSFNHRAYFIRNSGSSFYYSPDEEKLCNIPCPPKSGGRKYVLESNGHLHCIHLSKKANKCRLYVSEMIDDKWFNSGGVAKSELARATYTKVELLGMIREERVEDSMFLIHVPGQILICRFSDDVCEVLVDYRNDYFYQEDQLQFEFQDAHPFVASFASV